MVNQAAVDFYGRSQDAFLAMPLHELLEGKTAQDLAQLARTPPVAMSERRIWANRKADGSLAYMHGAMRHLPSAGPHASLAVVWDVTKGFVAQEALKRSHELLGNVAEQLRARTDELTEAHRLAQLGTWRLSADQNEMTWSDEFYLMLGQQPAAMAASLDNAVRLIHPDDRGLFEDFIREGTASRGERSVEVRILRPDGRMCRVRIGSRIVHSPAGMHEQFGYAQDISERWETEQAMLRSEKLAILGRLAGGIAHDFNNLLTIMTLNLEEAIGDLPLGATLLEMLAPPLRAAHRGAELTSQLLAYARQAPLRPQSITLNDFAAALLPLARRAVGHDYDLQMRVEDGYCAPLVDPIQLQGAVLNIILNARNAMPGGGTIVVQTAHLILPSADFPPELAGAYAMIAVTDSGTGIPPEILPRIFEPFYTTAEVGTRSGLGLSMVEGFMRQSGGHTQVLSRPGHGTTLRLFLPLASAAATVPAVQQMESGGRRVLLVEDQPAVLATVSRMFRQLGYEVCGVRYAAAALAELDRNPDFALIFTDVILPGGMDGIALSQEVARRAPAIRIVVTSGFSGHDLSLLPGPDAQLLLKPYKRQELLDCLNALAVPAAA